MNKFETFLAGFNETDWLTAVDELAPSIHEVDRDAVRIWFRFYPLSLKRHIEASTDPEIARQGIVMLGDFDLADQIDSSHHFLYGHRYWDTVKSSIEIESIEFDGDPSDLLSVIMNVAMRVADKVRVDRSLVNGIAAVGLMTFNQVGTEAFTAAKGEVGVIHTEMKGSPEHIVENRARNDSQGMFGFLRTVNKKFSVWYRAKNYAGKFPVMNEQEITQASALDRSRDWKALDPRCWEGPLPVECTSASCGTCWIGVLGGQDNLNEVDRRERRQMKVFGYNQPDETKPCLRLACQARATGNVTVVIPPWNAVFGKKVYDNIDSLELEPVTTSAKALRETIRDAVKE